MCINAAFRKTRPSWPNRDQTVENNLSPPIAESYA